MDKLTGLSNYITFEKFLSEEVQNFSKKKTNLFLCIVDIPNLREINVSKGREYGNQLLHSVVNQLKIYASESMGIGRLEGARFGIILEYLKEQEAYDWCVELFKSFEIKDEKMLFCVTNVDTTESLNKVFMRAYSLIDEANSNEELIINSDFKSVIPFKVLPDQSLFINELKKIDVLECSVFYKELPLQNKSRIKELSAKSLEITAAKKQIQVVRVDEYIYFTLKELGNVKAKIKSIDRDAYRFRVEEFRLDIHSPLDRKLYRVKAADNFKAFIRDNNRDYDVEVLNMNNKYMAIKIDRKRNFDIGSSFQIDIRMIIDEIVYNFETEVFIQKIEKIVDGYKFVLVCNLDIKNEEILQEYLASFQRDIIHDIHNKFN